MADSFIVTKPDGSRDLFAHVGNPESFLATMRRIGNSAVMATARDMEEAGFGREDPRAAASFRIARLGKQSGRATASSPRVPSAPSAPAYSLADNMRRQLGMPDAAPAQASTGQKAHPTSSSASRPYSLADNMRAMLRADGIQPVER